MGRFNERPSCRHDEQSPQGTNVDDGMLQDKKVLSGSPKTQHPKETELQRSTRQQGKYWSKGAEQHNACIDLWKAKRDHLVVDAKKVRVASEARQLYWSNCAHMNPPENG